jgi:SAM-dependent methyltransferase
MLQFVTKKEYWNVVDSGILKKLRPKSRCFGILTSIRNKIRRKNNITWSLKSVQDAIAYKYLHKYSNVTIAEIGGGESRVLPALAVKNNCYNIEEFKGVGQGPQKEIHLKGVTNILTSIGNFSKLIIDEQFDVIFSISVVEHVSNEKLYDFFKDCFRILKPSGKMIHLIDVYIEDTTGNNNYAANRVCEYSSIFDRKLFIPLSEPIIKTAQDVYFSTSFATNPDNVMEEWNRLLPGYKHKREKSQSCTLVMIGRKAGKEGQYNNY